MNRDIQLEQFQGPLDLLLQLIDQEKLNITEVALAKVTEQFFAHLNTLESNRSEALADFVVVGTKLVYLKSRQLLPYLVPSDEADGPSLADQLKMYQRYVDASKVIERLWNRGEVAYGRVEPPLKSVGFVLPPNVRPDALRQAFGWLLHRLKPINPLPEVSIDRSITVKQKLESIFTTIKQWASMSFHKLLGAHHSKTEVIVSFLALLELLKQGKVNIDQDSAFADMTIKKA